MSAFTPKRYQQDALDALCAYFQACHANSAAAAFSLTTEELYGSSLGYTPLKGFDRDMPYFCLRIPTGGGKTWLAARSVQLVNRHLLRSEHSVILWLTPSNAICAQTLAGLKDRDHPLHAALREAGPVSVLNLDEAKSVTRAALDTSTTVIVATRQAFQVENENLRKVYESNGALQHHFDGLDRVQRKALLQDCDANGNAIIPYSLVNVLRLRRPFIIVDEAHNNRTNLSFETLEKFRPSGIMELTATPDVKKTPSNVLYSVSAAELKAEEMIKLPIVLQTVPDWQQCLANAIDCRSRLQAVVNDEWTPEAKRLRPLVLIQAEPRSAQKETLHCEAVREELIINHRIPTEEIVIATGEEKGLEALAQQYPLGLNDPACPVKYVITQKALAEGWDCPWAYILVSVASLHSSTAVEQLLGRVLRQPEARRRKDDALNRSYAFVVSHNFTETASALRDQLVSVAGFERKDAKDYVVAMTPEQGRLDTEMLQIPKPVSVVLPKGETFKGVPMHLVQKVVWDKKSKTLSIKAPLTAAEKEAALAMTDDVQTREIIADAVSNFQSQVVRPVYPCEQGQKVCVPQLSLLALTARGIKRTPFTDAAGQLPVILEITPEDVVPVSNVVSMLLDQDAETGIIDVHSDGHISQRFQKEVQLSLLRACAPEHWDEVQLAAWLCRQAAAPFMPHDLKAAFIAEWLKALWQCGVPLAQAIRQKMAIRSELERKLYELRHKAVSKAYQFALSAEHSRNTFAVDDCFTFDFHPSDYYPPSCYDARKWGKYVFQKHYYPRIGDFDSKEEFECACFLDKEAVKGNIKFWIRNLVKTDNAFSLPKVDGKFYPDFVCVLPDSSILVVEYKGADRWDTPKVQADRAIGELWAELSGGKCRFVMVKDKDWAQIMAKI